LTIPIGRETGQGEPIGDGERVNPCFDTDSVQNMLNGAAEWLPNGVIDRARSITEEEDISRG